MNLFIFTDGGARGNPGPSAIGVYITNERGEEILSLGEKIGITTNNVAEYRAILKALKFVKENKEKLDIEGVNIFLDSELAYKQLLGVYKIKNIALRTLVLKLRENEKELGMQISYNHIRREKNKKADKLVNLALDNRI